MTAKPSARFLCAHVLQTVPFANLNRDDTNSVKTVQYGGVLRTRVSSQCWKRAVRTDFQQRIGQTALRTRRIGERVSRLLTEERGWPEDLAARAGAHLAVASGIKFELEEKEKQVQVNKVIGNALVYVPQTAVDELADLAEEHRADLEKAKDIKKSNDKSILPKDRVTAVLRTRNGVISVFGRMLAEVDNAGVDGAVQVAHVMTTHATDIEIDYFSAVDDVTDDWNDSTGSGHMGHAEFSAGTFYRYATIDLEELADNLGADTKAARELAEAFLHSFVTSLPQAKKNSTAPNTVPDLIHLTVRADRPLSLAAAFEKPVQMAQDGGYAAASRDALAQYADAVNTFMGDDGILLAGWTGLDAKDHTGLGDRHTALNALVTAAIETAFVVGDSGAAE
ncbi:CRISPR system Cascade subunit CasC [Streptomyces nodosus]|uniref:Type I-E CRISPR-associated protein Cas7/Cse4/CasC n=1 Tax=Streptomyces nodosus TaxID=40318 RepID=A0A5P2W125_9ACTN|nr:type I-E CRISPR-associated protein Cas7/Cse4/CasC [Streptomyces nodosus]MBB4791084.1 CRISPR system Cascade subunit CasC [Streptomyces nodosus]QEV38662.1 type I-E CRISPR-associated protein Cas7/Cse4/CasC [Streptomyces nodosus]